MAKDEYSLTCPHCGNELHMDELMGSKLRLSMEVENQKVLKDALTKQKARLEEEFQTRLRMDIERENANNIQTLESMRTELEFLRERNREDTDRKRSDAEEILSLKQKLLENENVLSERLARSMEEIYEKARKDAEESNLAQIDGLKKKIDDLSKINEDFKRRIEQGSQQLQGEVSEMRLEECLTTEFIDDRIEGVPKGRSGADVIQTVYGRAGKVHGRIVWEVKNVKQWSNDFIPKLRKDLEIEEGDVAVLVSNVFGRNMAEFSLVDGVWLIRPSNALSMARLLRDGIIRVSNARSLAENRGSIQDEVYEFFTSPAFRNRMENIGLKYRLLETEITKTKDSMERHWKAQRKLIDELVSSTNEVLGDVDSVLALEGTGKEGMLREVDGEE